MKKESAAGQGRGKKLQTISSTLRLPRLLNDVVRAIAFNHDMSKQEIIQSMIEYILNVPGEQERWERRLKSAPKYVTIYIDK